MPFALRLIMAEVRKSFLVVTAGRGLSPFWGLEVSSSRESDTFGGFIHQIVQKLLADVV